MVKVAIIGGGISGLGSAWYLSPNDCEVVVFEKDSHFGGHAKTIHIPSETADKRVVVTVNIAYDIFNEATYPLYLNLLNSLGVGYERREFSYTFTMKNSARNDVEWEIMLPVFANVRNARQLMNPKHARFAQAVYALRKQANRFMVNPASDLTYGAFLTQANPPEPYLSLFRTALIRPWGVTPTDGMQLPAEIVLGWLKSNRILSLQSVPSCWNPNGASTYVDALVDQLRNRGVVLQSSTSITQIRRQYGKVVLMDSNGAQHSFDHIIMATNANQALELLQQPTQEEKHIFSAFRYQTNHVVVHSDSALMPSERRKWSYFNILYDPNTGDSFNTVWFGKNQKAPVFLTNYRFLANPPAPEKIHENFHFEQPIFTLDSMKARQGLSQIQGQNNTWFGGVYTCGYGFHESGMESAKLVTDRLKATFSRSQ